MTSFDTGRQAEQAAANHLQSQGYQILDQNWRTKWCEIDIVALKDQTIYFVEVKYRRTHNAGSGLDYITSRKLQQMTRAAESWLQINNWIGDSALSAIEVTGNNFTTSQMQILV